MMQLKAAQLLSIVVACAMVQAKSVTQFILNGEDTETVPFYAYVEIFRQTNFGGPTMYFGGGTLIDPRAILTVAQNVEGFRSWRIGLGANQISDMTWFYSTGATIHPGYNNRTLANNIAIIHLDQSTPINDFIHPIKLLAQGDIQPNPFADLQMVGFGFGDLDKQPKLLRRIRVLVTSQAVCQFNYPHLRHTEMIENHFCARNIIVPTNMCAGDQGGPIYDPKNPILVGIQSFYRIADCSTPEAQPPVFVRIAQYTKWIEQHSTP